MFRKIRFRQLFAATVTFSLIAEAGLCGMPDPAEKPIAWGPVHSYAGRYSIGSNGFKANDETETWHLTGKLGEINHYLERYKVHFERPLFIRVEGQLSSVGRYDEGGRFPRELRVTGVISVNGAK